MTYLMSFCGGIIMGVYLDQHYKLPDVDKIVTNGINYLKTLEKENEKKK